MAEQAQTPDDTDAAASSRADLGPRTVTEDHIETLRVRRAPKYSVFLAAGAALGLVIAMILTFAFDGSLGTSPNTGMVYSQTQVFGFLSLVFITVGVVIGGTTALILDRVFAGRTRQVTVDRESIRVED